MLAALLSLLILPARAAGVSRAQAAVDSAFAQIAELTRRQENQDARTIAALNRDIESLKDEILALGPAALPPLSRIAEDPKRPVALRVWALSFAALTRDPAAFPLVKRVLLDAQAPASLRADAATDLGLIAIAAPAKQAAWCRAIEDPTLDALILHPTLYELSRLGCPDAAGLERWAGRLGPRPSPKDERFALWIIAGIRRARSESAAAALVRLLAFYPQGSAERRQVLAGINALPVGMARYRAKAQEALIARPEKP